MTTNNSTIPQCGFKHINILMEFKVAKFVGHAQKSISFFFSFFFIQIPFWTHTDPSNLS
jgi:hypothetical protein